MALVFVLALSIAVFAGRRIASRHEARIRKEAAFPASDLPAVRSTSGSTESNGQFSADRGGGASNGVGSGSSSEASAAGAAAAQGRGTESGAANEVVSNEDAAEAGAKDEEPPLDIDKYLLEEARKLMEGMEQQQQQQQQESEEETDADQRAERARLMDGGAVAGERDGSSAADRLGAAASGERDAAAAGASGSNASGNHGSGNHVVPATGGDEDTAKVQSGQEWGAQVGEEDEGEQEQQQEQAGVSPVRTVNEETGIDHVGGGGGGVTHSPTLNGTSSKRRTTRRKRRKGSSSRRRRQLLPPLSETCDLYTGEWVKDFQHHPLYSGSTCQFPLPHWTCRRKDCPSFLYEQFRWQPEGCRVPHFNRTELKERLRNKKVAFVGDSVGLQQFFSFLCLISPTPRTHEPYIESRDSDYKFNWTTGWRGWQGSAYRFPETNTTVLLKWTTSLCHVARKDWANESTGQAAHLDQPDEFLRQHMEEMDVIIMNTGHHWNINKMQEYGWHFHLGGIPVARETHKQMEGDFNVPMRTVLRSTAMWVHRHLQEMAEERKGKGEAREHAFQYFPPTSTPALCCPPLSNKMQEYGWQFHLHGVPVPPQTHKAMEGDFNVPMRTVLPLRSPSSPIPPCPQQQDERIWVAVPPRRHTSSSRDTQGDGGRLQRAHAHRAAPSFPPSPPSPTILSNKMQEYRWQFHLQGVPVPPETHKEMEGDFNVPMRTVLRSTAMWWNTGGGCDKLQSMLTQEEAERLYFQTRDWNAEAAVEGTAVQLLNITALSAMRPEAHLSRWYDKDGKAPGQQDCVHWCLPGVPDAWNELLFWEIVRSGRFPLPGETGGRGDRGGSTAV
ncbi:unnamed protein product [Closterium sp. Yama58-4]|nr:unnamed protein product [Closterium sp. Yama58-4]